MLWSSNTLALVLSFWCLGLVNAGLFFRDDSPYLTSSCTTESPVANCSPVTVSMVQTVPGPVSTIVNTIVQSIPTTIENISSTTFTSFETVSEISTIENISSTTFTSFETVSEISTIQNISSVTFTSFETVSQLSTIESSIFSTITVNTCSSALPPIPISPVGTLVDVPSTISQPPVATSSECPTSTMNAQPVGEAGTPVIPKYPTATPSAYATQTHGSGMPLGGSFLARDLGEGKNELRAKSTPEERALEQKAIGFAAFHQVPFGRGDFGRRWRNHSDSDSDDYCRRWRDRRWR